VSGGNDRDEKEGGRKVNKFWMVITDLIIKLAKHSGNCCLSALSVLLLEDGEKN
jgi:hypothetical protein